VVTVERPLGDAGRRREGVQLRQRVIRNQVREVGSVRRPERRIDVYQLFPYKSRNSAGFPLGAA
jgi:hypothetical protein